MRSLPVSEGPAARLGCRPIGTKLIGRMADTGLWPKILQSLVDSTCLMARRIVRAMLCGALRTIGRVSWGFLHARPGDGGASSPVYRTVCTNRVQTRSLVPGAS